MNRSIQLPSKIWISVCPCDGGSHERMYAVHLEAAMAQGFIWGWTLPTTLSCECFSPFLCTAPHSPAKGMASVMPLWIPEKLPWSSCLPTHHLNQQQSGQFSFPLLLCWQNRTARQETSSSLAQGEIWQAQTAEYLRGITKWLVYSHNFLIHFLHPKVSLHSVGGGERENDTKPREQAKVRAAAWQVHDRKVNLVLVSLTLADRSIFFSPASDQPYPPTSLCAFMFLLGFRWMISMIPAYLVITFSCKQFWW